MSKSNINFSNYSKHNNKHEIKGIVQVKHYFTFREKVTLFRAILSRNWILWNRFRISAYFGIISLIVSMAGFFFLNLVMTPNDSYFAEYGGDFFTFILLGITFFSLANITLGLFLDTLRSIYFGNWLEMILSSPMRLSTYFSMILIWTLIVSTINILIYIFIGTFIFGASIAISGSIIFVIIILILSIIAISGIGLISASTFLLYNIKGDIEPIAWIYATASGLLSGVLFPPSIFLDTYPILYTISRLLPQTYALEGIRRILNNPNLNPLNDSIVISDIVFLIIFSIILLPLGIIIFRHGLHKAEKDGKLARWAA